MLWHDATEFLVEVYWSWQDSIVLKISFRLSFEEVSKKGRWLTLMKLLEHTIVTQNLLLHKVYSPDLSHCRGEDPGYGKRLGTVGSGPAGPRQRPAEEQPAGAVAGCLGAD